MLKLLIRKTLRVKNTLYLKRKIKRILNASGYNNLELSLLLTTNSEAQQLNKIYRGVDEPTSVLSFAMQEGKNKNINKWLLGDVVISVPMARERARKNGRKLEDEILSLVCHGLLHLLGYKHGTQREAQKMFSREKELLSQAGIKLDLRP